MCCVGCGVSCRGSCGVCVTHSFSSMLNQFKSFIQYFYLDGVYPYRNQTRRLNIDLNHLLMFDETITENLRASPDTVLPIFERAAKEVVGGVNDVHVILHSNADPISIRSILPIDMNKLIVTDGIVIHVAPPILRSTSVVVLCRKCKKQEIIILPSTDTPRCCKEDCVPKTETIMAIDEQFIKLQELSVPTGEIARCITLIVNRTLVDTIRSGSKIRVTAYLSYDKLRVVGWVSSIKPSIQMSLVSEEEEFLAFSRLSNVYDKITCMIAPSITGSYTIDIKKSIACLLFGGTRRSLPDGIKLRGDINILLIGDPSTAKSQLLKFVNQIAPISVYTSGKGSSAVGLTASVIRDQHGQFSLVPGAMVLADGGVACIDEFDKMNEQDRVGIHEAMEQQTISISKAGINTILQSRVSVLAAANPVFGSFNDNKTIEENLAGLSSTILSRFDMIYVVRDVKDPGHDRLLIQHLLRTNNITTTTESTVFNLKGYIAYSKSKCAPTLSDDAAKRIQNFYVSIRQKHRKAASPTVPITVRQLQSIIRIAESLAKMRLSITVTVDDAKEAIRLFKVSTFHSSQFGLKVGTVADDTVMDSIRQMITINTSIPTQLLYVTLIKKNFVTETICHAIEQMVKQGELEFIFQRKFIKRLR